MEALFPGMYKKERLTVMAHSSVSCAILRFNAVRPNEIGGEHILRLRAGMVVLGGGLGIAGTGVDEDVDTVPLDQEEDDGRVDALAEVLGIGLHGLLVVEHHVDERIYLVFVHE